jgi:hypothetical protein
MARRGRREKTPPEKPVFIAAVRFKDGSRELFYVTKANDLDDARSVVEDAVQNISALLIAQRSCAPAENNELAL